MRRVRPSETLLGQSGGVLKLRLYRCLTTADFKDGCEWMEAAMMASNDVQRSNAMRDRCRQWFIGMANFIVPNAKSPIFRLGFLLETFLAPRPGLEPGTYGLKVRRSTN